MHKHQMQFGDKKLENRRLLTQLIGEKSQIFLKDPQKPV